MLVKADQPWSLADAAHLLNRAGFGGNPTEIGAMHALGREVAIDRLLAPPEPISAFAPPAWATPEQAAIARRERLNAQRELLRSLKGLTPEQADRARRDANQRIQRTLRAEGLEAQLWWFRRMLLTEAPLREKMTLFWHDHFATSIQKVRQPFLMVQQNERFRHHAFGSFKDLTRQMVLDPAMMLYLDTQNSRKGKPNENFAREVLELFTLGEGNYTEQDIREAARSLTGYRVDRLRGTATHQRRHWDNSRKTLFGKNGNFAADDVVDIIFEQPAAARHLPRKLWEYFVGENPPESVIDSLAANFRQSDFKVSALLREIFSSSEFYSPAVVRNQIKSPVQFLIQLLKQLELESPPPGFPVTAQQQLGQVLFHPPNVAGWDWGKAWINTNTLLTRYNLAGVLVNASSTRPARARRAARMNDEDPVMTMEMMSENRARRPAARRAALAWKGPDFQSIAPQALRNDPAALVDSLVFRFFQATLPDTARDSFINYATSKNEDAFTDSEVGELCHLILSTPAYQLC